MVHRTAEAVDPESAHLCSSSSLEGRGGGHKPRRRVLEGASQPRPAGDGSFSSYPKTVPRLWRSSRSLRSPASDKDELRLVSQCSIWGAHALPDGLLSSDTVSSAELLYPLAVRELHDSAADPAGGLQVHECLSAAADCAAKHLQLGQPSDDASRRAEHLQLHQPDVGASRCPSRQLLPWLPRSAAAVLLSSSSAAAPVRVHERLPVPLPALWLPMGTVCLWRRLLPAKLHVSEHVRGCQRLRPTHVCASKCHQRLWGPQPAVPWTHI